MSHASERRGDIMKAVRYHSYGDSDVLVYEEAARPVPGVGQVVVRVAGTSYNDADSGLRAGLRRDLLPLVFPHISGLDLAGVVTEVGQGVADRSVGDAVVALLPADAPGAAAEYVAVSAAMLAAAPRTVELADAAALPLVGLTAWQALFEQADLKPGQNILINGAGSAVGGYAVQLAAQAGAAVTATAGVRSRDRVRSYGADRIVGYAVTPVTQGLAGQHFDVVLQLAPADPRRTRGWWIWSPAAEPSSASPLPGRGTPGAGYARCTCSRAATSPSSPSWSPASTPGIWRSRWPSGCHWPTWPRSTPAPPAGSPGSPSWPPGPRAETWPSGCVPTRPRSAPRLPPESWPARLS